ncbi:hypothetical protein [Spongiimicrobium salis]|uniref:hypothetical protein n=1 Tax=Spongiimicrobium salis TaxID=1667022 RepID=UPI00374D40B1
MKTIKITGLLLGMAMSLGAQTFKVAPGLATDVSLNRQGDVFVQGTSGNIFKFHTKDIEFKRYQPLNSTTINGVGISSGPYRDRYKNPALSSRLVGHDLLLHLTKSPAYLDACLTTNNSVWALDKTGRLFPAMTFGRNNIPNKRALGTNNRRIVAVDRNHIYVVKKDRSIWHYGNSNYKLPGAALDIAYDQKQKKLYVIDAYKRILVWNTRRKNWDALSGTRRDFKRLSVYNGKIWATTTNNKIYTNDSKALESYRYANTREYKLKVTLEHISCSQAWDNDRKDDYLLKMEPELSINYRKYYLRDQRYGRIKDLIKKHGTNNSLYVHRNKNQNDHGAVQLHTRENSSVQIQNSGVFYIPKGVDLNKKADFKVALVVDEVSAKTERIIQKTDKLHLRNMLDYLSGHKKMNQFRVAKTENISSNTNGVLIRGQRKYYDMGSGYKSVELKTDPKNRPVIYAYVSGSKKSKAFGASHKYTKPNVRYRIELVD